MAGEQDIRPLDRSNNSLMFDILMDNREKSFVKSNFQESQYNPLKPKTNKFIQFKSVQNRKVYYRLGIIDFL